MIVSASGGVFVSDFEDLSFSCLGYNEASIAVDGFRSFFGHVDVAAYAFIECKMLPGCLEVAQMFKRLQDPERASPYNGVSLRSCGLLYGNYVASLRAEVTARDPSVDESTVRGVHAGRDHRLRRVLLLLLHCGHGCNKRLLLLAWRVTVVRL